MINEVINALTEIINNSLGGFMPYIEKYWMYLLALPLIGVVLIIAHYGFGVI